MELRSCRVTISDIEGVAHTVEVTAATLYEAVALGLTQIRDNEWAHDIAGGLNTVSVCVKAVQVEHTVRMKDFTQWLQQKGGSPAEIMRRKRIREVMGMPREPKL